jgi:hypothetical protein
MPLDVLFSQFVHNHMRYGVKKKANRSMRSFITILTTAIIIAVPSLQLPERNRMCGAVIEAFRRRAVIAIHRIEGMEW